MNDDADLVARVRRGDRQAFDDLYNRYADDVFSMCLLILGDPSVARAAAGTAFALVARTRLNPLSDPTRLRPWLLELARGSALAWSGSPQARSVPVPHGVSPEELLDGAIVPAPASLRAGLARTFDRAAAAAEAAVAAATRRAMARAQAEQAGQQAAGGAAAAAGADAKAGATGGTSRGTDADTNKIDLVKKPRLVPPITATPAPAAAAQPGQHASGDPSEQVTVISPATGRGQAQEGNNTLALMPLHGAAAAEAGRSARATDWRARPAIAVAAAAAVAIAGLTAVMSWPTSESGLVADGGPGIAVIAPTTIPAPVATTRPPNTPPPAPAPSVIPTVAGAYTSRPAPRVVLPAPDGAPTGGQGLPAPPVDSRGVPVPPSDGGSPTTSPPGSRPTTPPPGTGPTTPPPATAPTTPPPGGSPTNPSPTGGGTPTAPTPTDGGAPTPPPSTGGGGGDPTDPPPSSGGPPSPPPSSSGGGGGSAGPSPGDGEASPPPSSTGGGDGGEAPTSEPEMSLLQSDPPASQSPGGGAEDTVIAPGPPMAM